MIIRQNKIEFKPITIELQTSEEADAFFEIMEHGDFESESARRLAMYFSNALTNRSVEIPGNCIIGRPIWLGRP